MTLPHLLLPLETRQQLNKRTTRGEAITVETAVRIAPFYTKFLHVRSQTGCSALESQSLRGGVSPIYVRLV